MRFACLRQEFEIRNVELEMVCLPAAGLRKAKGEKWEAATWGLNISRDETGDFGYDFTG